MEKNCRSRKSFTWKRLVSSFNIIPCIAVGEVPKKTILKTFGNSIEMTVTMNFPTEIF